MAQPSSELVQWETGESSHVGRSSWVDVFAGPSIETLIVDVFAGPSIETPVAEGEYYFWISVDNTTGSTPASPVKGRRERLLMKLRTRRPVSGAARGTHAIMSSLFPEIGGMSYEEIEDSLDAVRRRRQ